MSTDELVMTMTRAEIDEIVRGYMTKVGEENADEYLPEKVPYQLAAHVLKCSAPTVYNWVKKGILVKVKRENKVTKASVLAVKKNHVKFSRLL